MSPSRIIPEVLLNTKPVFQCNGFLNTKYSVILHLTVWMICFSFGLKQQLPEKGFWRDNHLTCLKKV